MSRRLLLAALAIPLAVLGSTHGCSDEPPVEDYCAFMANNENCYAQFHKDLGAACGSEVSSDVQGSFASRGMLDICVLNKGGQAVLDPPIDLTKDFPGDKPLTIKLLDATGTECGSISYASQFSFSLTINPPPGADAGVDGGAVGSGENIKYLSGTVSSSQTPGRNTVDVGCSAPDVVVLGEVLQAESHHFNLNQISEGAANEGCAQFADIAPQAIVELNPGGVDLKGSLKVRINFPPKTGVKDKGGDSTAITPDTVFYLNCEIPGGAQPCADGKQDGAETDVDCGGRETLPTCPARCAEGQACKEHCDCDSSTICKVDAKSGAKKCTTPAMGDPARPAVCSQIICANLVQDGTESDVDCGGVCPTCDIGRKCKANTDCTSGNCDPDTLKCIVAVCTDGKKNGTETDVDCGGGCPPCDLGLACNMPSDCKSEGCTNNVCTLCGNKKQDPPETDVDCGGNTCGQCGDGLVCLSDDDCLSSNCFQNICVSCTNGKQDGQETDVDCGGAACGGKCDDGKKCQQNSDCTNNVCALIAGAKMCNTCTNGSIDGSETDLNCGGGFCDKCADGLKCTINVDCTSGKCIQGICDDSCDDGTKNGTETDIDCGGSCVTKCPNKGTCAVSADCFEGNCVDGICYPASCANGAKDGTETDIDCGSDSCPKCADGKACKMATDCVINGCVMNTCSHCGNGVKDGPESDVDCGEMATSGCAPCAMGKSCAVPADCASNGCTNFVCD